jgi:dihydroorotate dehydrogenase electron transfer subunit
LGNGFDTRPTTNDQRPTTILTAGGMGVAPLLALAEELSCRSGALKVLVGAKTKKDILCENDFRKLGAEISIATEDGSRGYKGLVTSVLQKLLTTNDYRLSTIYACGPNAMLKTVAALARKHSMPCQISFEEHMACGIGVCLGCPVRTRVKGQGSRDEYKMVCKDGPVFNSEEIVWE